jgi:exonuclease I
VATQLREYKSFEEARDFVRKLKLINTKEWQDYCKSGQKPEDIPAAPERIYKQDGWKGMGDWLGTGSISNRLREYKSFEEARDFVHKLKVKSQKEWSEYCKSGHKPEDIPASPESTYKQAGWKGMGDWLGTGSIAPFLREYKPFEEARDFVHKLKLKSRKEWRIYCKSGQKPEDIPSTPEKTYNQDGWRGFGDWIGTGNVANFLIKYKSFEEARNFVHKLKLKSAKEWKDYCKSGHKPEDIPANPNRTYNQDGWKGYGDWLGTG